MDIKKHTSSDNLEKYSFWWSEARLLIAAISLFLGGIPLAFKIFPIVIWGLVSSLLILSWVISGLASAYLLYRWHSDKHKLFGGNNTKDTTAFLVSVISGLNLGIMGIIGTNIGMAISSSSAIFIITGLIYIASALYLYKRWNESGKTFFKPITIVESK